MATPAQPPQQYSKEDIVKMVKAGMSPFGGWQNAGQPLDLSDANLVGSNLSGEDLSGANLRNSDLRSSQIAKLTIAKADLRSADLRGLKFNDVELSGADLRETNLQGADLSGVKAGMLPWQLAGTNLTGATLPKPLETLYEKLGTVSEISDSAKKLFLMLLAACLYSWLTVATTKDVDLITNRASSPLPIIQTAIPIVGFYVVAPIILSCVYLYFHFYLQKLWEELAQLPAIFTDGKPLYQRADPWLFNDLVRAHFSRLKDNRPFLSKFQHGVSILLAWWLVPITLLIFWLRYLPRHDHGWTYVLACMVGLCIGFAIQLHRLAKETLRGKERTSFGWKPILKQRGAYVFNPTLKRGRTYLDIVRLLALIAALTMISHAAINGTPETRVVKVMAWFGYSPFADLRDADVSIKPPNWPGKKDDELDQVKGANLSDLDLRYAKAHGAFLAKAQLLNTNLEGADLSSADLREAESPAQRYVEITVLSSGAHGQASETISDVPARPGTEHGNHLAGANLSGARLSRAKLRTVFLARADLSQIDLTDADLSFADLTSANLIDANLTGAIFQHADFSQANLLIPAKGTYKVPVGTNPYGPDSPLPAKLLYAHFEFSKGLSPEQIKQCSNWKLAFYGPRLSLTLGLSSDNDAYVQNYRLANTQEDFESWKHKYQQRMAAAMREMFPDDSIKAYPRKSKPK